MLAYSDSSPPARTRVGWRNFDSCRGGLTESKFQLMCGTRRVRQGSPSCRRHGNFPAERVCYDYWANGVANHGLTFVSKARHPNVFAMNSAWEYEEHSSCTRSLYGTADHYG